MANSRSIYGHSCSQKTSPLADNQIAELFGRDVKTIGKHINNALREELAPNIEANDSDREQPHNSTVAKFATVQIEGGREVTRQVEYYNLDVKRTNSSFGRNPSASPRPFSYHRR